MLKKGTVFLTYIPLTENLVNIIIKPFNKTAFYYLVNKFIYFPTTEKGNEKGFK